MGSEVFQAGSYTSKKNDKGGHDKTKESWLDRLSRPTQVQEVTKGENRRLARRYRLSLGETQQ